MALEGLNVILEKEPVVPTPTADRLVTAPEAVDAAFLRHVRSYIPFGRSAGAAESGEISVADYEKRLIEKVKNCSAPKGYITAEFGYGKTSTAVYLWDRCRAAGLLTVPPFQLGKLDDLIHATYGWVRYEFNRTAPGLIPDLEALYRSYSERSIESDAGGDPAVAAKLRELLAIGRYHLTLVATDYITFLEQVVELGKRAGYAGLVILPDEVQQYLEPAIRGGSEDPIAPIHNVVEALNTRKGRLSAGLIFILPRKELGVINDQRGDLIQRLKMDGLALDLSTVYDKWFAFRLWQRLAEEFDFADEANRIVTSSTLDALGQIAARDDLANGPRTVIAAFAWMTRRFLEADGRIPPATPVDLVDALLAGEIVFDGTSKLQTIVQAHLKTPLVAGRPEFRQVIKAFAAFPTEGATEPTLNTLGLWAAAEELDRLARGDISIMVGGGFDDRGVRVPYGYTLRGLEPQSAVAQDWLTQTLREFSRNFSEAADKTIERAEAGFIRLLTDVIFRQPYWKCIAATERRKSDGVNRSLLFEGSFPATAKRFPERQVLIRILREGEQPDDERHDVDAVLDVILARRLDADHQRRRSLPGQLDLAQKVDGRARLILNLFHREGNDYYPELQAALQPVMMPNLVTPLLMLALHEYVEEKRRAALIPKEDEHHVEHLFQRPLLEHSADELFNKEIGAPFNARGPRVIEELFRELMQARYPTYQTLIRQQGWRQALKDYELALERLSNRYERQGTPIERTRDETAKLFNKTNTALDSFIDTFSDLIAVEPKFRGRERSKVRFLLHPFEEYILQLLQRGQLVTVLVSGRKASVHELQVGLIEHAGARQGYRPREIGALLDLMVKRELIEIAPQRGTVREVAQIALTIEDLVPRVTASLTRVSNLLEAFPSDALLSNHLKILRNLQHELSGEKRFSDQDIVKLDNILRNFEQQLAGFLEQKRSELLSIAQDTNIAILSDTRRADRLAVPIEGKFFAPHLDGVRRRLLDEHDALRKRRDGLAPRIHDVIGNLNNEAATDEMVIRGRKEVEEVRRQVQRLENEEEALNKRVNQLATARRLLVEATDFHNRLAVEGQAIEDASLVASFRALMERIQEEFSSRKDRALDDTEHWEAALGEMRNRLNERLASLREAFDRQMARYRQLFQEYAGVPPAVNPISVTFNAADPVGSQRALVEQVSHLLTTRLQRMKDRLLNHLADVRQLLASGDLAFTDTPTELEAKCWLLIEAIIREDANIQADLVRAGDVEALGRAEDGSALAVFQSFGAHFARVQELDQQFTAVLTAVKPRQLEPEERKVLEAITRMCEGKDLPVDIGAILHDPTFEVRSLEQLWPLLESLYRKRRIRIQLGLAGTADASTTMLSSG